MAIINQIGNYVFYLNGQPAPVVELPLIAIEINALDYITLNKLDQIRIAVGKIK